MVHEIVEIKFRCPAARHCVFVCSWVRAGTQLDHSLWSPRDIILHCPLRSTLPASVPAIFYRRIPFHSTGNVVFMRINLICYSYRWSLCYIYWRCSFFCLHDCCSNHLITCTAIVDFLWKELREFSLPAFFVPPRFIIFFLYYPLLLTFSPYDLLESRTTSVYLPLFFQVRHPSCVQ